MLVGPTATSMASSTGNASLHLLDRLGLLPTWPKAEKLGWPTTDEEIFKERAQGHPVLGPLFELHYTLGRLRKLDDTHRARWPAPAAKFAAVRDEHGAERPTRFAFAPAVWVQVPDPAGARALR